MPEALAGGMDTLRHRMVRDLELFLSYALAPKGQEHAAKPTMRKANGPGEAGGNRVRGEAWA